MINLEQNPSLLSANLGRKTHQSCASAGGTKFLLTSYGVHKESGSSIRNSHSTTIAGCRAPVLQFSFWTPCILPTRGSPFAKNTPCIHNLGEKWIHGVSSICTSAIHYVSDTPRVSSGYPMYPVYPYVSLCIPMYHPVYPKYMSKF